MMNTRNQTGVPDVVKRIDGSRIILFFRWPQSPGSLKLIEKNMETIEGELDEQIRLLNSVKKQLELIGKYCPSLANRISFICILKLLEELIEKLREKAKDELDIHNREKEKDQYKVAAGSYNLQNHKTK